MVVFDKEDCAIYLHTGQANVLKVLYECLKELIGDVNMEFSQDGVRILRMDQFHSLMVDCFLDKEKLEEYYCPKEVMIGISIPNLHKLLRTVNNSNLLTMYMLKKDQSKLELLINNADSNRRTEFGLNLLDIDNDEDIGFPEDDYKLVLNLTSADFKQICADAKSVETKQIKITYSKGQYIFSAKGNLGPMKTTIQAEVDNEEEDNEIFEGNFDLEKLISFTKCASITKNVNLYLGNDLPLICDYELSCGSLRLLLSLMDEQ
jgi:proliferating cell nuclear antigen